VTQLCHGDLGVVSVWHTARLLYSARPHHGSRNAKKAPTAFIQRVAKRDLTFAPYRVLAMVFSLSFAAFKTKFIAAQADTAKMRRRQELCGIVRICWCPPSFVPAQRILAILAPIDMSCTLD
jgi:hypothetical protein